MKRINIILDVIIIVLAIVLLFLDINAKAEPSDPFNEPVKLRCTCYLDSGTTASGKETRLGIMAGKPEWIGCVAELNEVNEDGSIGDFIGYFEILDTGYGAETGIGQSKIFSDRTLGTIETGQTVDVYFETTHQAEEWVDTHGDYLWVKIIDGKG